MCHKEPLFTDNSYRNNGLSLNDYLKDYGRMKITGDPADSLKFIVPSLRNVSVTFPYMHDERLYSLYKVVDHYISGIQVSTALDSALRKPIILSTAEKNGLVYFLHNKRFSHP